MDWKNDQSRETYNANSDIKFKSSMIRSNLYDYSDSYMHFKGTIAVPNTAGADSTVNNTNKKVIFRNCAPFTDCMSEINNTQADDDQDINIALSICNLIEYSNAY